MNREKVVEIAESYIGIKEGTKEYNAIINAYNSVSPKPIGYTVKYSDNTCDVFVTHVFDKANLSKLIGRECGVQRHIEIFKSLGIWEENDDITPKSGDIICYNWNNNSPNNIGWADHIGIVQKVSGGYIYAIEGNYSNSVKVRKIKIGNKEIRGFAQPKYEEITSTSINAQPSISSVPIADKKYDVGTVYTVQVDNLNVRFSPNGQKKEKYQLTPSGQKESDAEGQYKKGTRVTCKAVAKKDGDTWIKTPSGWICAIYKGKYYVK